MGYDFEVYYKLAKENRVADSLSHQDEPILFEISLVQATWLKTLHEYYQNSHEGKQLSQRSTGLYAIPGLVFRDCPLFIHDRLFIPQVPMIREALLSEFHSSIIGGHSGIHATTGRINASFFWQGVNKMSPTLLKNVTSVDSTKPLLV